MIKLVRKGARIFDKTKAIKLIRRRKVRTNRECDYLPEEDKNNVGGEEIFVCVEYSLRAVRNSAAGRIG